MEEILTPAPPVFSPKRREIKEDEHEPRSMSLDSRIESLLSGCMSPEAPAACQAAPPGPSSQDTDDQETYAGTPLDFNTSQNIYRAQDKVRKMNFNRLYLCYFNHQFLYLTTY